MMYPYMVLADGTEITHSHIIDDDGTEQVRCVLPTYQWKFNEGFSTEEIRFFEEFLRHNAHLLYRYAAQGGISCA